MPDTRKLTVGDRIRIIAVAQADVDQWQRLAAEGSPDPDFTYRVLKRMADLREEFTINRIDEYGQPWFDYSFRNDDGQLEEHTFALMESESWEYASRHR